MGFFLSTVGPLSANSELKFSHKFTNQFSIDFLKQGLCPSTEFTYLWTTEAWL